ncbi:UPF0739 protein C1orf74 homolog [Uloborus diversus]|uniref:UPF0739 protein C1orf74 homolog n=1 Tax=Uloborus diversus TaxID=327109 RepID=UPI002408F362|nr:UPF0739 protein C1orf74 homolog [Uloborus diversus]
MSSKWFKNCKSARRHLLNVLFNLQAVDKEIKPCYLWDAFPADISEVKLYLNELYSSGQISKSLNAFLVNDTIFVTRFENLKTQLDNLGAKKVKVIDVSKENVMPIILPAEEKSKVLKSVMKNVHTLLSSLTDPDSCDKEVKNADVPICNITTLYGVLVGYPVLYWYSLQSHNSDFTCLSMVPLKVYKVMSNFSSSDFSGFGASVSQSARELFSFSIPENVSNKTESLVNEWFDSLLKKCSDTKFCKLEIMQNSVTLPYVSL